MRFELVVQGKEIECESSYSDRLIRLRSHRLLKFIALVRAYNVRRECQYIKLTCNVEF